MPEQLVVKQEEWPHGLRCIDCDRRLTEGTAYSQRLLGVYGDVPIVEIVCVPCGLGLPHE